MRRHVGLAVVLAALTLLTAPDCAKARGSREDLLAVAAPFHRGRYPLRPLEVVVRLDPAADAETFRARLNGRDVTDQFGPLDEDGLRRALLFEWHRLKAGRNVLRARVRRIDGKGGDRDVVPFTVDDTTNCSTVGVATLIPIQTRFFDAEGNQGVLVGNTFYPANDTVTAGLQVVTLDRSAPTNTSSPDVQNETYDLTSGAGLTDVKNDLNSFASESIPPIVIISSLSSPGAAGVLADLTTAIENRELPALGQTFALANLTTSSTYSLIGVPGFAPGVGAELSSVVLPGTDANINGALTQSSSADARLTGDFTFVYQDAVTYTSTPRSDPPRNQLEINGTIYPSNAPSFASGGFQVVVLDRNTLDLVSSQVFATNQSSPSAVQTAVTRMAGALAQVVGEEPEESLVFVASIGSPVGSGITSLECDGDSCWGLVAEQIAALGGNPYLFNQLGEDDTYFLIGTGSPPAGSNLPPPQVEEISTINFPEMINLNVNGQNVPPGSISGVLSKGPRGLYQPVQSDFTNSAAAGFDFFPLMFAPPIPWTYAAGTRTPVQDRVYQYLSQLITAPLNPTTDGDSDIRACYTNLGQAFSNLVTNAARFVWTSEIGAQCNCQRSDWEPIRSRIEDELQFVEDIAANFSLTGNFPALITDATIGTSAMIPAIVDNVFKVVETSSSDTSQIILDVLGALAAITAIAGAVFSAGGTLIVEAAAFGIASGVLNGGMTLTGALSSPGAAPYGAIQTEIANLESQLSDQYEANENAMQNMGQLIVSDWGKLEVAGQNFMNSTWELPSPADQVLGILYIAMQRSIYQSLLTSDVPLNWRIVDVFNRSKDTIAGQSLINANNPSQCIGLGGFPTDAILTESNVLTAGEFDTYVWTTENFDHSPPTSLVEVLFEPFSSQVTAKDIDTLTLLNIYQPYFFNSWPFQHVTGKMTEEGCG